MKSSVQNALSPRNCLYNSMCGLSQANNKNVKKLIVLESATINNIKKQYLLLNLQTKIISLLERL